VSLSRPPDNDLTVTTSFTSAIRTSAWSGRRSGVQPRPIGTLLNPFFITDAEDPDTLNGQALFTVSAPGLVNQTVTAIEADKDLGVIISTNALTVPEGGTNSFTVQLK